MRRPALVLQLAPLALGSTDAKQIRPTEQSNDFPTSLCLPACLPACTREARRSVTLAITSNDTSMSVTTPAVSRHILLDMSVNTIHEHTDYRKGTVKKFHASRLFTTPIRASLI
jgi:hypothetical protein